MNGVEKFYFLKNVQTLHFQDTETHRSGDSGLFKRSLAGLEINGKRKTRIRLYRPGTLVRNLPDSRGRRDSGISRFSL